MIVTVTLNPAVDVSSRTERVEPDHKLRCERPRYEPGGGGINVARAIHRLGGEIAALWTRGGPTGDHLAQLLDREGIVHHGIPVHGTTRENLTVRETSSEHQYRFTMPGAEVSPEAAAQVLDEIVERRPRYVVASGSLPPGIEEDWYGRLAELCAERDIRCIVDTSGKPLRHAIDAGVWLIKPNLRELGVLAGGAVESDREIEETVTRILDTGGAHAVLVSLGGGGALLRAEHQTRRISSPTVPIRSKVGAGDSMVAGLVVALERGKSLPEAARTAVAAGAAAVMTPGSELCRAADVEKLLQQMES